MCCVRFEGVCDESWLCVCVYPGRQVHRDSLFLSQGRFDHKHTHSPATSRLYARRYSLLTLAGLRGKFSHIDDQIAPGRRRTQTLSVVFASPICESSMPSLYLRNKLCDPEHKSQGQMRVASFFSHCSFLWSFTAVSLVSTQAVRAFMFV